MSSTPPLFHVGYHKTGTTWLQRCLFQPQLGWLSLMSHQEVFRYIVRPHGLTFNPGEARSLLETRLATRPNGSVPVVSSEILSGNPLFGGRESDDFARRIAKIIPDARILITIRKQFAILVSIYMQYLLRGGTLCPKEFFANNPEIGYNVFAPEHFEYHRLVALYQSLFGRDRVLVLTHEAMVRDPLGVARQICAFAGNPVEITVETLDTGRVASSAQEFCVPVLRRLNYVRPGPAGSDVMINLGHLAELAYRAVRRFGHVPVVRARFGRFRPVSGVVERRFADFFADSNRQLAGMLGDEIDLSIYMR